MRKTSSSKVPEDSARNMSYSQCIYRDLERMALCYGMSEIFVISMSIIPSLKDEFPAEKKIDFESVAKMWNRA